jgi:Uma2 family endonuclease
LWIENGVSLGWLIDPGGRSATVYRRQAVPVTVTADWLAGEGPVDGFRFDLREIWSVMSR